MTTTDIAAGRRGQRPGVRPAPKKPIHITSPMIATATKLTELLISRKATQAPGDHVGIHTSLVQHPGAGGHPNRPAGQDQGGRPPELQAADLQLRFNSSPGRRRART